MEEEAYEEAEAQTAKDAIAVQVGDSALKIMFYGQRPVEGMSTKFERDLLPFKNYRDLLI